MLSRRQFTGSLLTAATLSAQQATRRPPNVLVVMSDQESGLLPGPANLPNREKLLDGATQFTHAYCNTPQCSASRATLLTGLAPHRTGVLTNVDGSSLGKPLPESLPNVGNVFQLANYQTGYFGKWHLGGNDLMKYGFATASPSGADDAIAIRARNWIREQTKPWLAWVSFLNPHDIYEIPRVLSKVTPRAGVKPPESSLADLQDKPIEQQEYVDKDQGEITKNFSAEDWVKYRSYYLELVEKVDEHLGTLLSAVEDLDSTIVVYTSDHGDSLGEHGLPFKGPYMYEELIRVPLIIRAPGRMKAQVRNDLVTLENVAPTLASLAGIKWPGETTGRSLAASSKIDTAFLEYYAKQKWVNPIRTIRTQRWKFNWYDRGNRELYDLNADPNETRNLAGKAPTIQSTLEKRLTAWRGPLLDKEAESKPDA